MADVQVWENGQAVTKTREDAQIPEVTAADLDAIADAVADQFILTDLKLKALGFVIADLVEAQFGMTQAQARQEVRDRFRNYYRGFLG